MTVRRRKDNNTWMVDIQYPDYTGQDQRHRKSGFSTQREAKAYERDFRASLYEGQDMTFAHLVKRYEKRHDEKTTTDTHSITMGIIEKHILPYFKDTPIDKITPTMIQEWQKDFKQKNDFKPTYQKKVSSTLSAIFNFGVDFYDLPKNPVKTTGHIGERHADKSKYNFWTQEEFNLAMSGLRDDEYKNMYLAFFTLAFYTGLRRGEILALTKRDFHLKKRTHYIHVRATRHDSGGEYKRAEPKTPAGKRVVGVPAKVMTVLRKYTDTLYGLGDDDFIFPFNKSNFPRKLHFLADFVGVKKITTHGLRHSYATFMVNNGVDIYLLQQLMGHETIDTTIRTYSHLYDDRLHDVTQMINKLI